jgi:hypothetical protein
MALHGFENREAQSFMVYHHFPHYIKDVNSHFEGIAILPFSDTAASVFFIYILGKTLHLVLSFTCRPQEEHK